ncbi:MAG: hypothetical protein LBR08_04355 [Bacteroidales bacterium]|jgi:hypothetical protein|nr:hypothetical protein [Bacteroidales bacterium]
MKIAVDIKDLPVAADFVMESLRRDLSDFSAYSPKFTNGYLNVFGGKTSAVKSVVAGKIHTKELGKVTVDLKNALVSRSRVFFSQTTPRMVCTCCCAAK